MAPQTTQWTGRLFLLYLSALAVFYANSAFAGVGVEVPDFLPERYLTFDRANLVGIEQFATASPADQRARRYREKALRELDKQDSRTLSRNLLPDNWYRRVPWKKNRERADGGPAYRQAAQRPRSTAFARSLISNEPQSISAQTARSVVSAERCCDAL